MSKNQLFKLFGMNKSSYYYGKNPKSISLVLIRIKALIRQIFKQSNGSAGARTIRAILNNEHGITLSRYKVAKLMAKLGLKSCQIKRHHYRQADEKHSIYDNILDRNFSPEAPNQVWTGDVTYIRIKGGWCYLAVVLDLYARRLVGFAISSSPDSKLTVKALQMAYHSRMKPSGVLFHSDQGSHYSSQAFAKAVADCSGMTHSMSRKGNCWDNAPTERFFRSFKTEWMPKNGYENMTEAKTAIVDYIWGYYQTIRPHAFNDYLSPAEKEKRYFNQTSYQLS